MKLASRRIDQPEPGYFLLRLVKGGPQVAACIRHDAGLWSAEIDGEPCGPAHADPSQADGVFRIWHAGRPTTAEEFAYRLQLRSWAVANDPSHPAAQASRPVDLRVLPPLF